MWALLWCSSLHLQSGPRMQASGRFCPQVGSLHVAPNQRHRLQQAKARLERLDKRIQELKSADPPARVAGELRDLLGTECFLPAVETDRIPKSDTALSLKEWWTTGGGGDWLESFLELPRLGPVDSLKPHVVVQADARKTLDLDAHRQHPLSTLLCPLVDSRGAETRG